MTLAAARFEEVGKPGTGFDVMFNPASIKVSYTNKVQGEETGGGKSDPKQSVQATTAKLETELVFDSTETGTDVREHTSKLGKLVVVRKSDHIEPPKHVSFSWGRFAFFGVIESLSTTFDFWSAEGVPLRSTIQLTMVSLDGIGSRLAKGTESIKVAFASVPPGGRGTTEMATKAGDPRAGRMLAAANRIENMRMAAGGVAAVSGGVQLKAAAGFSLSASAGIGISAGAGAGFGIGASAGAGASASVGAGAGAGFAASAGASAGFGAAAGAGALAGFAAGASAGASASAGFGASAAAGFAASDSAGFAASASAGFGASASAGVAATSGAFAGLGVSKSTTLSAQLDPSRALPVVTTTSVGPGTRFDVTGRVIASGSAGLSANVNGVAVASAGIRIG
jgi:hypothetical protein